MRLKIVTFLISTAFLAEANHLPHTEAPEENKNSDYSFSYGVKDIQTGDVKDQWESKQNGVVKGQYSIMEADGMLRTVEYVADKEHGFNAVVKYNTKSHQPMSSSHQEVQIETDPPRPHHALIENKYEETNPKPTVLTDYRSKLSKPKPIKESYKFPIDLSFLETNSKVIPLTISKITPVEIKLDDSVEPKGHLNNNNNRFSQPFLETDFKPLLAKLTAQSAKKPIIMPGLRNYAAGQTPNIKIMLQPEIQEMYAPMYKQFPEKKLINNIQMLKLRQTAPKRLPTIIAVKYH